MADCFWPGCPGRLRRTPLSTGGALMVCSACSRHYRPPRPDDHDEVVGDG